MNKNEKAVIEDIIHNVKSLDADTKMKVMYITQGMVLAGGIKDEKDDRR